MDTFNQWLEAKLADMGLDVEVFAEYVVGIMSDQETDLDERVENAVSIVGATVEDVPTGFEDELKQQWQLASEQSESAADAMAASHSSAAQAELQRKQEEDLRLAAEADAIRQQQAQRSRQEQRHRDQLLEKYGFQTNAIDEEGNVIASEVQEEMYDIGFAQNTNRTMVRDVEKAQRAAAKEEHAKKVARDRELLAQQRMKKEAEKKRTQKREKRRGAG